MIKSYLSKDLLLAIRQLSPSMLLLSLTLHGLVLLIPLSSFSERKIPYGKTTSKQEQIHISKSKSSQFFTDNKALVKQKDLTSTPIPTNNPQFTSQLPSPPQDATAQTQLPIPQIQATPTLPPQGATISSNVPVSSKKVQQATDSTAAVVVAPIITPKASPKKQNSAPTVPVNTIKTPATPLRVQTPNITEAPPPESPSPEASPTLQEKETFDNVFGKLNSELSLSFEPSSQPENVLTTPGIQNNYGTAADKTPEEVAENVKSKLEAQGFKVSQQGNYASGILYVVTKNKFTEYVTFTPNNEATGTVIITWVTSPLEVNTQEK